MYIFSANILDSEFFCGASLFVLFTKCYFRGTCGICGGKEKFTHGSVRETLRKETTWKTYA
jgi:hypothetical protein